MPGFPTDPACQIYRDQHMLWKESRVRTCLCGKTLDPRKRFCEACTRKRRRKSWQSAQSKSRCQQLTEKTPTKP